MENFEKFLFIDDISIHAIVFSLVMEKLKDGTILGTENLSIYDDY